MTDEILEYMRNEIEKYLNEKTEETWTVTCESEHLDFQFLAKVQIAEDHTYGVRSASYSMLNLSEVEVGLMLSNANQMMLAHFNTAKERYENG